MTKGYPVSGVLDQLPGAAGCSLETETTVKDAWSVGGSHVPIQGGWSICHLYPEEVD